MSSRNPSLPHCLSCGYLLTAREGACPECGERFNGDALWVAERRATVGRRWSAVPAGIAIAILGCHAAIIIVGIVLTWFAGSLRLPGGVEGLLTCSVLVAPLSAFIALNMQSSRRNWIVFALSLVPLTTVVMLLIVM